MFKSTVVNIDINGQIINEEVVVLFENPEVTEVKEEYATLPTEVLSNYVAMDEDDLFDYEKIVIPYTADSIHYALTIDNGVITDEITVRNRFNNRFSLAEFGIAVESEVFSADSNDSDKLHWIQMQTPGIYKTPAGVYSVFRAIDGSANYTIEGSPTVWRAPSTIDGKPEVNEELTALSAGIIPEPEAEVASEIDKLVATEEFQRMRAMFNQ